MKTIIYFLHNTKFSAYFQWKTKTLTILFSYRFEQTKQVCEGKKIGSSFVRKELPILVCSAVFSAAGDLEDGRRDVLERQLVRDGAFFVGDARHAVDDAGLLVLAERLRAFFPHV